MVSVESVHNTDYFFQHDGNAGARNQDDVINLGDEAPDRIIVIGIMAGCDLSNSSHTHLNSVQLDSVTQTRLSYSSIQVNSSDRLISCYVVVPKPTGTSATLRTTWSSWLSQGVKNRIAVWRVTGGEYLSVGSAQGDLSGGPSDVGYDVPVVIPPGGCGMLIYGCAVTLGVAAPAITTPGMTRDMDSEHNHKYLRRCVAAHRISPAGETVTATVEDYYSGASLAKTIIFGPTA